ncbi:MAG TPA: hypothetical protein VL049_06380 [Candidatus Dormibacteraeota bacterium]|nr:hypothetical protein [Candidatus Dormibacteraeota bacterium]
MCVRRIEYDAIAALPSDDSQQQPGTVGVLDRAASRRFPVRSRRQRERRTLAAAWVRQRQVSAELHRVADVAGWQIGILETEDPDPLAERVLHLEVDPQPFMEVG